MDHRDLISALKQTGTGEKKIAVYEIAMREQPHLTPGEMVDLLAERDDDTRRALWPEGTISKARALLEGTPPGKFLGTPPPMGKEASEERLGRIIADQLGKTMRQMQDRQEDKQSEADRIGIGNPVKPSQKEEPPAYIGGGEKHASVKVEEKPGKGAKRE